jgi:cell division protein FtsI (penicillin-binding protein 3)
MGRAGIERAFDARLTDPRHRGEPIALSIDARVQTAMESELGRAMVTFQAKAATGLVLDVHTGEVIAMASLPVYNPNKLTGTTSDALRNNVTQSVYELGSTFKPITMATAIQSGTITSMARRFDATAPLKVGGFTIHDERGDPKRWLNIPETLIYSSNVATARIADELGKDTLSAMFTGMGFGERPSIELRERAGPIWPRYWGRTTVMTTAYGHGIAVTPLHLANAYATMVNGGIWRPTTLLKVAPGQAPAGRRVLSEQTSAPMRPATASAARPAPPKRRRTAAMTITATSPPSLPLSRWTRRAMWCWPCSIRPKAPGKLVAGRQRRGTPRRWWGA